MHHPLGLEAIHQGEFNATSTGWRWRAATRYRKSGDTNRFKGSNDILSHQVRISGSGSGSGSGNINHALRTIFKARTGRPAVLIGLRKCLECHYSAPATRLG